MAYTVVNLSLVALFSFSYNLTGKSHTAGHYSQTNRWQQYETIDLHTNISLTIQLF